MAPINVLEARRLRDVRVKFKRSGIVFTYTCYDQDEGVWKEEDGTGWAHVVQLFRHPKGDYEPKWMPVARLDDIDKAEVLDFWANRLGKLSGKE